MHAPRPAEVLCYVYIENLDVLLRLFLVRPDALNLMNHIEPLSCATKDCVLVIEPGLNSVSFHIAPERGGCDGQLTVFSVVIKNWLPFVFGPAFAMLTV